MTHTFRPQPFIPEWPEPAPRFLRDELPPPPALPLIDVFGPRWADWLCRAAEAKSAPPDYPLAGLLSAVGSAIGNTHWAMPWAGWAEPPILWTMAIGMPSSNKSPGLDAVLSPLRKVEDSMRRDVEAERATWSEAAEIAKIAESTWKEAVKRALKEGEAAPERPAEANPGPEPFLPRLAIADGTVERLAVILSEQPRGTLLVRDELSGWLQGMTRYAGGGSDRPFWLEAYGGRGHTVERMGRPSVHVDRLAIGVVGSIQPDRLRTLLLNSDDDGLLARFLPLWPDPAPIRRPDRLPDEDFIETALTRLHGLDMKRDEQDQLSPWIMVFSEAARDRLDTFRHCVRGWENESDGLLLSFIGKLPGLAVRLSLILTYLDWLTGREMEPTEINAGTFERAALFIESYALPMARRAYPSEKKEEFLEFVTKENFEKHGAFLSNPLLASMMLLTFEEYGDIPERKHVFYDKCFQVLLREHDASKGRFRRRYSSGLSHEELESVFTFFCVFSYLEGKYNFQYSDVEAIVSFAVEACGVSAEIPMIIEDFVDAISILQKDGNYYEFTHRSFQEYFYARFAVKDRDLNLVDKIDEIRETNISDGAIRMIADMDKTYFERNFLLPVAGKLLKEVEGVDHEKAPDRLIAKFWARIGIRRKDDSEGQCSPTKDEITVYYSTTHDDEEYPKRKLNLLLLKSMFEYDLEIEQLDQKVKLSEDEKLRIFRISELPPSDSPKRTLVEFKINHQNRHRLVALQSGLYAVELNAQICALVARLEKDISAKTSKLSAMIRSVRS